MSKEQIIEALIKWFENYDVIIPDGSSATIKDFMIYSEIQSMAEELYEYFFTDLQSQLAEKDKKIEELNTQIKQVTSKLPASYEKEQNKKAIEQLRKVKEFALILANKFTTTIEYHQHRNLIGHRYLEYCDLSEYIDQQINELKGKVENVKD